MKNIKPIIFSALAVLAFFAGLEIALRLAGFRYQRNLSYMQFGYPNRTELHQVFIPDPNLLFRMKPGYDFGEGFNPLNREGFRGKDFEKENPAGVFRIACLGDSVTFGTPEGSYPEMLEEILSREIPGKIFQVYNFGIPGYSSWQGKILLNQVFREYHPDLVIIFYGWNDLWLARGFSDSEQVIRGDLGLIKIRDRLSRFRTYQLLNQTAAAAAQKFSRPPPEKFRVPLPQSRKDFSEMVGAAQEKSALIILATAPAGFGIGPLPDYFEYLGFVKNAESLEQIHNRYNLVVRKAAAESGAPLVDLDLIYKEQGVKNFFDRPDQDIIHPNRAGLMLMARSLAAAVTKTINGSGEKEELK